MTNALLSVTRVEGSDEPTIRMRIRCASSRVEFCKIEMTLEEFALLITGVSEVPVDATYKGLDKVGRALVTHRTGHSLSGESLVEWEYAEWYAPRNPADPGVILIPGADTYYAETTNAKVPNDKDSPST